MGSDLRAPVAAGLVDDPFRFVAAGRRRYDPGVLTRLLTVAAIVSLLLAIVVSVFWWRSTHGHVDEYTLGPAGKSQTRFTSGYGRIMVEDRQPSGWGDNLTINGSTRPYAFRNVMGGCMVVPAFLGAVFIRRKLLPRPPNVRLGRGRV